VLVFRKSLVLRIAIRFFWIFPLATCYGQEADLDAKLAIPVHDYALTANSFAEGLLEVASQFRIPIGIQWVSSPKTRARFAVDRTDATVKGIIEAIVDSQPGYRINVNNGVVHITTAEVNPKQNFVLLPVRSFDARQELVEMAQQKLRDLVKAETVPPKAAAGGVAGSLISNVGEPRIDVHVTDATVEDVLDALATASTFKIWVVTFNEDPGLTPTGFRRTATLRNGSEVPDDDQPVWETFGWNVRAFPSSSPPR
jgi:hypothetical protein